VGSTIPDPLQRPRFRYDLVLPVPPIFKALSPRSLSPSSKGAPSLRDIHECLESTACDLAASGPSDAAEKQTHPNVTESIRGQDGVDVTSQSLLNGMRFTSQ
jgi:hypothetical protein